MGAADQPADARLFADIAAALWGGEWAAPAARALGLNVRTVQRLKAAVGEGRGYPLNPRVLTNLAAFLRQRAAVEQEWAVRLDQVAALAERR